YSKSLPPSAASTHESVSTQTPSVPVEKVSPKPSQSGFLTRGSSDHAPDSLQPAHLRLDPACRKSAPRHLRPRAHLPYAPDVCADGPNTNWSRYDKSRYRTSTQSGSFPCSCKP